MKKYILIVIVTLVALTSCEDFFDMQPKGKVEENIFYKDLNNLRIGLNAVYSQLQQKDYQLSELIFGEALSDNAWNLQDMDGGNLCQLLNFQFNTENPYLLTRYKTNYDGINMANQVIRSVPHLKYRDDYETNRKEIREVVGQAKLLRALFYFNLVRTFGGVSIQPDTIDFKNTVIARSSTDEVYAYIEKDLREAVLVLRRNQPYLENEAGQAAVGAAFGLLLKVLVYQASPGVKLENPNSESKLREALEIGRLFFEAKDMTYGQLIKYKECYKNESWENIRKRLALSDNITPETLLPGQEVTNMYALADFDLIYRMNGEFCKESLLEINHHDYSSAGISGDYNEEWKLYYNLSMSSDGELAVTPTKDLASIFANDPRALFTYSDRNLSDYYREGKDIGSVELGWFNDADGLGFTKYYTFPWEGSKNSRNYRVLRYSEAVLLYAEILNETGNQEGATLWLNKIRDRARKLLDPSNPNSKFNNIPIANFKNYPVLPYDLVKANIMKERRIELAGEFDRWYDIVRLGIVEERMKYIAANPPAADPRGIRWRGKNFRKGVNEIFPIPQREVLISNGVIKQNFGY